MKICVKSAKKEQYFVELKLIRYIGLKKKLTMKPIPNEIEPINYHYPQKSFSNFFRGMKAEI